MQCFFFLNPIRLCSLVMEGPSEPIENDLAARRRDEDGEVYYATTEDDATTTHHTAPPSEPPLPIMNSLSPPQDRGISVVPDAVVRAAALMLASQSVSRQRSESMNPPSHQAGSPLRPLELSASLSPTQRGASTAPSGNPNQQSFNASVGYTQPSASHAGRSSHTGSSVRPAAFAK
ncbi:unnamed protein product [Bodo saltans]|uniref:Uncharacterized protein n=1 Tax=Bodo saltans TaxID=75058 RepID=A0A0S4KGT7_BODSA|nr:unnamed protein product [Bodo saltans]|eukprot:CUI14824.1 unnamed protein product [Bodo saltans]